MVTRYGANQAYRVGELGEPMEDSGGGSSEKPVADPDGQICWALHGLLQRRSRRFREFPLFGRDAYP